jgi:hypothetical protein
MKTLLTTVLSFTAFSVSAASIIRTARYKIFRRSITIRPSWSVKRIEDLIPFLFQYSPECRAGFWLSCGQKPSPRQGERNPTRHTEELVSTYFLRARRVSNKILLGKSSEIPSCFGRHICHRRSDVGTAMTLCAAFRGRAFFLSDRTEDYRLKFFSNKLRALMRYRDAVIGRLADWLWTPFTGADLMSTIKA